MFQKRLSQNPGHVPADRIFDGWVFIVIGVEFVIAAFSILGISGNLGNALLLGYSLQRILIFLATILPGLFLGVVGFRMLKGKVPTFIDAINKNTDTLIYISFTLALAGFIVVIAPASLFGQYKSYFERLQPLLVAVCLSPTQLSLKRILQLKVGLDKSLLRYSFVGLSALFLTIVFISISKFGITPDTYDYWKLAGIPITYVQYVGIFFISLAVFGCIAVIKKFLPASKNMYFDFVLVVAIYLSTVLIWVNTPLVKEFYYSKHPIAPYYQPFPFTDAQVHDLGALSIINGWGIDFGQYTDKPLYMVFLAFLHLFAGNDYNLLAQLQVWFLAFVPVVLYWLGRSFHSRFLGLVIALTISLRQQNAIYLSNIVDSANPRVFITEVPTLLGLIIFTWLVFLWIKNREEHPWMAFAAGSVLGIISLIRLNPLLLLPATFLLALFVFWQRKQKWMLGLAAFVLGFVILMTPWILTGQDGNGQPYFIIKFLDIINVRYHSTGVQTKPAPLSVIQKPGSFALARQATPQEINSAILDIYHFPGFVINHFSHNLIASFLELPDSVAASDQELTSLVTRPYWLRAEMQRWSGEVDIKQLPFLFINLCLIALGLGWSWKRWQWAGLVPLFIFLTYDLALGLARCSGSRYLVPIDWIIFFYFSIGVINLLGFVSTPVIAREFEQDDVTPTVPRNSKYVWRGWPTIILVCLIASLIPIADNLIPPNNLLCESSSSLKKLVPQEVDANLVQNMSFTKGYTLYPEIRDNVLTFTLLTCKKTIAFDAPNFKTPIGNGEMIIVGFSDTADGPDAKMIISDPTETQQPQFFWQRR